MEKTFTNRSLFVYFWSLVSGIISGTLTFDDFFTSTKYFRQHDSCVSRAPVLILNFLLFKAIFPNIFAASTRTTVLPETPSLKRIVQWRHFYAGSRPEFFYTVLTPGYLKTGCDTCILMIFFNVFTKLSHDGGNKRGPWCSTIISNNDDND